MTEVLHESKPKARKVHTCVECLKPIEPGTVYFRQHNVNDGQRYAYKAHQACSDEAQALNDDPYDEWCFLHER